MSSSVIAGCSSAQTTRTPSLRPSQGIKGAHIHNTTANPFCFPSPTISAFSPLPSSRPRSPPTTNNHTPISTGPLAAHNWYVTSYLLLLISLAIQANDAPAPIVADIISSKAPPLPKEVAKNLLNENKNRRVQTAINASRVDPVLASALENAFAEALSKVESNASYKAVPNQPSA
ncbi:uncharacterized protein ARMOST_11516 [Armillaria ostoyae]|uniref:Uncharacterized protein n=1 Tax=Armillaria ostoyae TaxID=47428 RepID=A0A284RHC2_ARMOS|nr:uncharacterized protein ARMOST_11516 [Armillaria ostoyae]